MPQLIAQSALSVPEFRLPIASRWCIWPENLHGGARMLCWRGKISTTCMTAPQHRQTNVGWGMTSISSLTGSGCGA